MGNFTFMSTMYAFMVEHPLFTIVFVFLVAVAITLKVISDENEGARRMIWGATAVVIIMAISFWFYTLIMSDSQTRQSFGLLGASLWGLYLISSFFTLREDEDGKRHLTLSTLRQDERGAILLFDKAIVDLEDGIFGGLTPIPWLFCKLITTTSNEVQIEIPADPKDVYTGDEDVVPPGKVPAIRMTFAQGAQDDQDPLAQRLSQEIPGIVSFTVISLRRFIREVGDYDNARQILLDAYVEALSDTVTKKTLKEVMPDQATYNALIMRSIKTLTSRWGIRLRNAKMKEIKLSHSLNSELQRPAIASAAKRATIIKAQGDKERLILEGEGEGGAEAARLGGIGTGLDTLATTAKVDPMHALGLRTAEAIVGGQNEKVIVAGDVGFAQLAAMAEAILKGKAPQTPPPVQPTPGTQPNP